MQRSSRNSRLIRMVTFIFPILRLLFRIEFYGLKKIPDHPVVLVSNHNIGAAVEILALLYAWEKRFAFKFSHPVYGLTHRFAFRVPLLSMFIKGLGAVPADYASAQSVLQQGATLIIFPGGNWEAVRPFSERWTSDFGGRKGWIQVAKTAGVPILPIAIAGSHGVNPVLLRSKFLARVFLLKKLFGVNWFPVSIGQLLWSSLFLGMATGSLPAWQVAIGAFVIFCGTPLVPIWPAKIVIQFCDLIDSGLPETEIYGKTEAAINEGLRAVRSRISQ